MVKAGLMFQRDDGISALVFYIFIFFYFIFCLNCEIINDNSKTLIRLLQQSVILAKCN